MKCFRTFTFLIIVQILSASAASTQVSSGRIVPCTLENDGKTCKISGLNLTKTDYHFTPSSPNPEIVEEFYKSSSIVPVLTKSICAQSVIKTFLFLFSLTETMLL